MCNIGQDTETLCARQVGGIDGILAFNVDDVVDRVDGTLSDGTNLVASGLILNAGARGYNLGFDSRPGFEEATANLGTDQFGAGGMASIMQSVTFAARGLNQKVLRQMEQAQLGKLIFIVRNRSGQLHLFGLGAQFVNGEIVHGKNGLYVTAGEAPEGVAATDKGGVNKTFEGPQISMAHQVLPSVTALSYGGAPIVSTAGTFLISLNGGDDNSFPDLNNVVDLWEALRWGKIFLGSKLLGAQTYHTIGTTDSKDVPIFGQFYGDATSYAITTTTLSNGEALPTGLTATLSANITSAAPNQTLTIATTTTAVGTYELKTTFTNGYFIIYTVVVA